MDKFKSGQGIGKFLEDSNISYTVCNTINEFNREIKTDEYNLYLLVDDCSLHNLIQGSYYNNYFWYMYPGYSYWLYDLYEMEHSLKEKLRAGQSLFYIYGGGIEHFLPQTLFLNELLGVSFSGYLPSQDWEVDVADKLGEDLSIKGSVIRCWPNFTTVEGEISQEYSFYYWGKKQTYNYSYPVIFKNRYGKGDTYTVSFNPFAVWNGQEEERDLLLRNITEKLRPEIGDSLKKESLFSLKTVLENPGNGTCELRHEIELPAGFQAVEDGGYRVENGILVQEFSLEGKEEIHLTAYGITAGDKGEYEIRSVLYYYDSSGEKKIYKDISLECKIE